MEVAISVLSNSPWAYAFGERRMADRLPNKSDEKSTCNVVGSLTQPVMIYPDEPLA